MDKLFYTDFESILRILISAPLIYFLIIINIKLMGKRTTSKLNSFDWIVTVAMGSIVGSVVMQKDTPLINGLLAIFMMMGLQYIITKLMVKFPFWKKIVREKPRALLFEGEFLLSNMKKERVVEEEILAAVRERGIADLRDVYAVVMETDASLSVIKKHQHPEKTTLQGVDGLPKEYVHQNS